SKAKTSDRFHRQCLPEASLSVQMLDAPSLWNGTAATKGWERAEARRFRAAGVHDGRVHGAGRRGPRRARATGDVGTGARGIPTDSAASGSGARRPVHAV